MRFARQMENFAPGSLASLLSAGYLGVCKGLRLLVVRLGKGGWEGEGQISMQISQWQEVPGERRNAESKRRRNPAVLRNQQKLPSLWNANGFYTSM